MAKTSGNPRFRWTRVEYAGAAAALVPAAASAQDFNGGRVEARVGYETPTVSGDGDIFKIGSAVSYGAEAGYDLKASNSVTVGPFVSYEMSTVENCDAGDCLKIGGTLNAGVRVGFVVGGNGLIYGKVNYSKMKVSAELDGEEDSDSDTGFGGRSASR